MQLQKVELFSSKRDIFYFLLLCCTLFIFSLSYQYYQYKQLTKFDSQILHAEVLKHYKKTKQTKSGKLRTKYIAKLKADDGSIFYTITNRKYHNLQHKHIELEVWAGNISFLAYLKGYFAFSKILHVSTKKTLKETFALAIAKQHKTQELQELFNALFLALAPSKHLQQIFSQLGISHLVAISGFHLGILSAILFFLFRPPYSFLQNRYFPYRSYHKDSFIVIAFLLLSYMLFLGTPDSLLRTYGMFVVGFLLYERGFTLFSMQTLLVTLLLLLSLFPKLFFSLGFALSITGVFYIFLFAIYAKNLTKWWQFILLPFWMYLVMLPYSIAIFGNFNLEHPFSILWTTLFSLFYPLELFLHLINHGNLLDRPLTYLLHVRLHTTILSLSKTVLLLHTLLSLGSIYKRFLFICLLFESCFLFIYFIYNVT